MTIQVKRVYEKPAPADGRRYLVDRLWPRGLSRDACAIDAWLPELGPSHELRRWFAHDPSRWAEFERRYFEELASNTELWIPLVEEARRGPVTLLYSARDERHNQAVALAVFLRRRALPARAPRKQK